MQIMQSKGLHSCPLKTRYFIEGNRTITLIKEHTASLVQSPNIGKWVKRIEPTELKKRKPSPDVENIASEKENFVFLAPKFNYEDTAWVSLTKFIRPDITDLEVGFIAEILKSNKKVLNPTLDLYTDFNKTSTEYENHIKKKR